MQWIAKSLPLPQQRNEPAWSMHALVILAERAPNTLSRMPRTWATDAKDQASSRLRDPRIQAELKTPKTSKPQTTVQMAFRIGAEPRTTGSAETYRRSAANGAAFRATMHLHFLIFSAR
jgi:hypothetical protein